MNGEIRSYHAAGFDVPLPDLWDALIDIERYPGWWPWLVGFEARDFASGEAWRCRVRAPLGYRVAFDLRLEDVRPLEVATASITGDIAGHAIVRVEADGEQGSRLELRSWLAPSSPWLRRLSRVAGPITTWGHDRVLETGLRQFRSRAFVGDC